MGIEHVFLFNVLLHHDEQGFAIASELVFITCAMPRGPRPAVRAFGLCSPRMTSVGAHAHAGGFSKAETAGSLRHRNARTDLSNRSKAALAPPSRRLVRPPSVCVKLVAVPVVGGHGVLDGRHGG